MKDELPHVDSAGKAHMVDVGAKAETHRRATATGSISMKPATLEAIRRNEIAKGDVLAAARIAGIMAAKKTSAIIPLCHPIALSHVHVEIVLDDAIPGIRVETTAECVGKTGVEMEALVAASTALLTVYDMAKSIDRGMIVTGITLLSKSGGRSGEWTR
jgi:cyclic pyranopterin phosphate synthase